MIKYTSFNDYCRREFGGKVYKIALSCSESCPNRDGTVGVGGCIFCAEGSGTFAAKFCDPIEKQLADAKQRVAKKSGHSPLFVAYFQAFTSTYGDPEHIKSCLLAAADDRQVVAVSVGTRADCLTPEILEILAEVGRKKRLFVELGLQTVHEKTAELINRCCPLETFKTASENLKAIGAEVVYHLILGLPGETKEMMLQSVKTAVKMGANGLKLQLLHVLRGTRLEEMYLRGEFETLEMEEYIALVADCLRLVPPEVVIHRLTGDGDKRLLVAPKWSADKKRVLNQINRRLKTH